MVTGIPIYKITIYDVCEDDTARVADMLRDMADRIEEHDPEERVECKIKRGHVTLEMQTV